MILYNYVIYIQAINIITHDQECGFTVYIYIYIHIMHICVYIYLLLILDLLLKGTK